MDLYGDVSVRLFLRLFFRNIALVLIQYAVFMHIFGIFYSGISNEHKKRIKNELIIFDLLLLTAYLFL